MAINKSDIPKIPFKEEVKFGIEVFDFQSLFEKIKNQHNHNPHVVHRISFYFILIVTKNSYSHYVDFKKHKLKEGSILFIAENQIHKFGKDVYNTDGYCIIFTSSFFNKSLLFNHTNKFHRLFNYHIEEPTLHSKASDNDNLIHLVEALLHEYKMPDSDAKLEILYALLKAFLLKSERAKEIKSLTGIDHKKLEVFSNFKTLLEQDYQNTRSSRDFASKLLISYKALNNTVKSLTGKTAKAFIDDFVTIEIKRYLSSTSLSIKEISYKTGFEEPANLIKFFKKQSQITPLKFRQQHTS